MTPWVYVSAEEDGDIDDLQPELYRRKVTFRDRAHEDWKVWALGCGGEVIAMEGPKFRLRVPAESLLEVAELQRKHGQTTERSVSIGIGTRLSEADDALEAAQTRGPETLMLYGAEVQEILAQKAGAANVRKSEVLSKSTLFQQTAFRHRKTGDVVPSGDIHDVSLLPSEYYATDEYGHIAESPWEDGFLTHSGQFVNRGEAAVLASAKDGRHEGTAMWRGQPYGESDDLRDRGLLKADQSPPQASGPQSPQPPGPKPLEANSPAAGGGFMGPQPAPDDQGQGPVPDQKNPHEVLSALASQQGQKDQANQDQQDQAEAQDKATGDLKTQLLGVLKVFKAKAQELEGLSQQDPDMYKALTGMVQILIELSRGYFSQDTQVQKAEHDPFILHLLAQRPEILGDYASDHGMTMKIHGERSPAAQIAQGYGQGPQQFRPGLGFGPHGPGIGPGSKKCVGCGQDLAFGYNDGKCNDCWNKQVSGINAQNEADVANHPELSHADLDTRLEFADRRILSRNGGLPVPGEELSDETLKAEKRYYKLEGDAVIETDAQGKSLGLGPVNNNALKAELQASGRKHIVLPVGSSKDPGPTGTHDAGKIKIADPETGHSKWRSVRAGLVMAPDGTPVSSRNPSGR